MPLNSEEENVSALHQPPQLSGRVDASLGREIVTGKLWKQLKSTPPGGEAAGRGQGGAALEQEPAGGPRWERRQIIAGQGWA